MFVTNTRNELLTRYRLTRGPNRLFGRITHGAKAIVAAFLFAIGGIVFAAAYVLALPMKALRRTLSMLCFSPLHQRDWFVDRVEMSPQDAVWMADSPANLMIINVVLFLKDHMSEARLQELFLERVTKRVDPKTGHLAMPRFTKKMVKEGSDYYWETDRNYDIRNHIFEVQRSTEFSSQEEIKSYIEAEITKPLSVDRSRWQMQIIQSMDDNPDPLWSSKSIVLFRIHHAMADGISLVKILLEKLMDEDSIEKGGAVAMEKSKTGSLPYIISAIFWTAYYAAEKLLIFPDRSIMRKPDISGLKKIDWTYKFPAHQIKIFRQTLGLTVNDIMSTIVAGGFRRYVEKYDPEFAKKGKNVKITSCVPFNVRSSARDIKMENHFSIILLPFAVEEEDVVKRIMKTKSIMDNIKDSPEPLSMYLVVKAIQAILPAGLCRWLINITAMRTTLVFTNVPGPSKHCRLGGNTVSDIIFWVPARTTIAVGISIFSYGGSFRIGIISDSAVIPQPSLLAKCLEEEYESFCTAIPGSAV